MAGSRPGTEGGVARQQNVARSCGRLASFNIASFINNRGIQLASVDKPRRHRRICPCHNPGSPAARL